MTLDAHPNDGPMPLYRRKYFWMPFSGSLLIFLVLFAFRMELPGRMFFGPPDLNSDVLGTAEDRSTWMNIYQGQQKIGYAHKVFENRVEGFRIRESVYMRINTMGMVQDLTLRTRGDLKADFSLSEFDFEIRSGRFSFSAGGHVRNNRLRVNTHGSGANRSFDIKLNRPLYMSAAVLETVDFYDLNAGEHYQIDMFDPLTMTSQPVKISIIGREEIDVDDASVTATKVKLTFKGATQFAWIGEGGDILREKGLLGIRLEKTDRAEALADFSNDALGDLTRLASIPANRSLADSESLKTLSVDIGGVETQGLHLDGGRQTLTGNRLTIRKESLDNLAARIRAEDLEVLEKIFLEPSPLIESDHPRIRQLVSEILSDVDKDPLTQIRKLVAWVYRNIEKRPVVSVPDALSTLENRSGDCNEHAVLVAALARAAGVPARIETGLVYLDGRFYYHAWNTFYLGRWITADSIFNQIPADVTHIRFAAGAQQQVDLLGLIGNLKLTIVSTDPARREPG